MLISTVTSSVTQTAPHSPQEKLILLCSVNSMHPVLSTETSPDKYNSLKQSLDLYHVLLKADRNPLSLVH